MKNLIYPCLWFDGQAKEAAQFYTSVFRGGKITCETPVVVNFELDGQQFMCLNGGSYFNFTPAISFYVTFETEQEFDNTWESLNQHGKIRMDAGKYDWSPKYGWVEDKFGVNWQMSVGKMAEVGQKFIPFLMFTGDQAGKTEKAINFYGSVFENSGVVGILKDEANSTMVKHAQFNLSDFVIMAMDSDFDHGFGFNEAISFVVSCKNQDEIDYFWKKLSAFPEAEQCGWLKDQFGVSWQIVPDALGQWMSDPGKAARIMKLLMPMKKLDITTLENA